MRIKTRRWINLIYQRDVIFAFCECREREREREREIFGKRAVGVGTCNGAHNLCTNFFENIFAIPEPVWYMFLKTENCYLKIFMKICVSKKVCWNMWNIV